MNALGLYISTCRYVMQADGSDQQSWVDLYKYLPYLRQALSCCVCGNLARQPMGPSDRICQHFVCKQCIGGRMRLRPACGWCKDYDDFKEIKQLRVLVLCFKSMCDYILHSPIGAELSSSTLDNERDSVSVLLKEAMEFQDDYVVNTNLSSLGFKLPSGLASGMKEKDTSRGQHLLTLAPSKSDSSQSKATASSKDDSSKTVKEKAVVSPAHDEYPSTSSSALTLARKRHRKSSWSKNKFFASQLPKLKKQTHNNARLKGTRHPVELPLTIDVGEHCVPKIEDMELGTVSKKSRLDTSPSENTSKTHRICKCGKSGGHSRLTCLGQRCPCYSSKLPCLGCKCRGCRNPKKNCPTHESYLHGAVSSDNSTARAAKSLCANKCRIVNYM